MKVTSANENIEIMRNAFAALARKDIDTCISFMTPDFIINLAGVPYQMRGPDAWRKNAEIFFKAFPDIKFVEEDMFASGDRVAVRFRFTGTHNGDFLGNAATGKKVSYDSYEFYRIADGKIAEEWISSDMLTILTQIGAFPPHQLIAMYLSGYRVWFAAILGLAAGAVAALTLGSMFS
ncbi:ester cyclase [Devosia sp. SL43]|uniref:ester cyclase n=1 Tax=Devosia sp. SL43 TaxID=2806348 RepID=UPI001F16607D|nr:ester cyclase [Devosia sp. SL43]UJW87259.1 ester cyclase [Devosia sp. SL43]